MTESNQTVMMFCLTIIAVIGIISAVVCYSKDQISFKLKAKTKLSSQPEAELGLELEKDDKIENR